MDGAGIAKASQDEGCCSALLNYGNEESGGDGTWDDSDVTDSDDSEGNNIPEESNTSEDRDYDYSDEELSPPHYLLQEQVENQLRLLDIDSSRSEPFLCSQCQSTDLLAALDQISEAAQGAANPVIVAEHAGLDPDCALCSLFARTLLSGEVDEKGSAIRSGGPWKLSAFNKRCMLMDIRISWMFQPLEVAILYAGENAHIEHINDERVEREGFIACARTRDLRALLEGNQSTETEPLSRFVLPQYDPGLVREWLGFCDFDLDGQFSIAGMRVIDCQSCTIVNHVPGMAYFALSYVWGLANADMVEANAHQLGEARALPLPQMIPRVVSNAIQVAKEVGYRYLWVDQFCIDQSASKEHIAEHISKMDLIYSKASLTLIAASTGGSLPGVGGTPRVERLMLHLKGRVDKNTGAMEDDLTIFSTPAPVATLRQTVWYSRGWCFQESVLAPRKLFFMDREMVFQAEGVNCSDSFPEPHEMLDSSMFYEFQETPFLTWSTSWNETPSSHSMSGLDEEQYLQGVMGHFSHKVDRFHQLLEVYTAKQLTMDSDSINGFAGAMKVFSRHDPYFKIISGLPFFDINTALSATPEGLRTITDFQELSFFRELCWAHTPSFKDSVDKEGPREEVTVRRNRRGCLPSWSWAGWSGQASWAYMWTRDVLERSLPDLNIKGIEWEDGSTSNWPGLTSLAQQCCQPKCLLGEAYVLSGSDGKKLASWKGNKTSGSAAIRVPIERVRSHLSIAAREPEVIENIGSGRWSYLIMAIDPRKESEFQFLLLMLVAWDDAGDVRQERRTCHRLGIASATVDFDIKALPRTRFRLG